MTDNVILQITDLVTTRKCALRIDSPEHKISVGDLFDRYLMNAPLERLRQERRITEDSSQTLASLQDLVYISSDSGMLEDSFAGVEFRQDNGYLDLDDVPHAEQVRVGDKHALVIDLQIDRTSVAYDRNWVGFHRRRWDNNPGVFADFVDESVTARFGVDLSTKILDLGSTQDKMDFVEALARGIWDADFENFSRFTGRKLVYKSGDETVLNIVDGGGGICSEKVQALKFLTDHYGLESEYVLSGPDTLEPVPEGRLREMLTTFDFQNSKRFMRYWQHTALLYTFDGVQLLVDATNGNVPFLFVNGTEVKGILGYEAKRPIMVRMAVKDEDFYYHRVSQDVVEDMLFAMEGWIPFVDLVQVFDNELGLCITKDYMVTPVVFRTEKTFDTIRREYLRVCGEVGLDCEISDCWSFEGRMEESFAETEPMKAERILDSYDHLLDRYDDAHGPGHEAGLAIIRLARQ